MVTSTRSRNHENDDFWNLATLNRKVASPKWSRIIPRRFWATFLINFTKIYPRTPPDSNSGSFRIFYRNFHAGVGVGMLMGARDSLTSRWKRFLGFWFCFSVSWFLSSWFQGFVISWFQSFLVSCFQRFKKTFNVFERYLAHITKLPFHVFDWYWSHIQDMQDFLKRIVGSCRCPSFRKMLTHEFPFFCEICGNNKFKNDPGIFLIFVRCPGVSKDK